MEVRSATSADVTAIREIARRSLEASYSDIIGESAIANAVETWYADESLHTLLDDEQALLLVAAEGEIVGFAQGYLDEGPETVGTIHWLHVDPAFRGQGFASRLFDRTKQALLDRGAERLKGLVIEEHDTGNEFYRDRGFELAYTRPVEIDGETHVERVYVLVPEGATWEVELEPRRTEEGETVFVVYDEREVGSKGPMYAAYWSEDRERRYGWFCSNCGSFDVAMDTMGHMVCNGCSNTRKATRWDAAYL